MSGKAFLCYITVKREETFLVKMTNLSIPVLFLVSPGAMEVCSCETRNEFLALHCIFWHLLNICIMYFYFLYRVFCETVTILVNVFNDQDTFQMFYEKFKDIYFFKTDQ